MEDATPDPPVAQHPEVVGKIEGAIERIGTRYVAMLRHTIGDAGVYSGWQDTRQASGAVLALASRFTLPKGRVFRPR